MEIAAEWRQKYVAKVPEKLTSLSGRPLDKVEYAIPFQRTFLRFLKAVVCLGIPYLLETQHREGWTPSYSTDEEEQAGTRLQRPDDIISGNGQPLIVSIATVVSRCWIAERELKYS